uniref:Galectin n=1 Tax=Meloidogyne hapla TaxID=6305 RepID=A0A1I8B9E0_MELHA
MEHYNYGGLDDEEFLEAQNQHQHYTGGYIYGVDDPNSVPLEHPISTTDVQYASEDGNLKENKAEGVDEMSTEEMMHQLNIGTEQLQDVENVENELGDKETEVHENVALENDTKDGEDIITNSTLTNNPDNLMAAETNYPIPYRSKLTEQFEPGQTLILKGKTAEDSVRFTINLHHASPDFSGNDVPLHISVRFDEGKIVYNTFAKGEWGKEERKSNPYKKGDDIDLRIRAHDSKFTIFADQKEIKEYEHRVPLSSVTHFSIDGDILVTHIHWGGKYYPVPYESGIVGEGFAPGKTLLIFGTPEKKGKRFHINLAIIRNSLIASEWGNEEREGKLPLEKGIGFDLKIVNEEYAFQVFNFFNNMEKDKAD